MGPSLQEKLTIQFYEWEKRGRGWYVYANPVHLEPEFMPFFGHTDPNPAQVDDGLRKNIFLKALDLLKSPEVVPSIDNTSLYEDVTAYPFVETDALSVLRIVIPKDNKVTTEQSESLLLMISSAESPVSFEIIGTKDKIALQFVCRSTDLGIVYSQLKAYFPFIIVTENPSYLEDVCNKSGYGFAMDYGLGEECMRPIGVEGGNKIDPFTPLFGIMDQLQPGERITLQILFERVVNPWAISMKRSVTDPSGDAFFLDSPEMVKIMQEKISRPLFAVCIRVLASADNEAQAATLMKHSASAIIHLSASPYNRLIPMPTDLYDFTTRIQDIQLRQSHRVGMFLNSKELSTFVHIPNESVASKKLERDSKNTHPAPVFNREDGVVLGINEHQGVITESIIPTTERLKHTHVIGGTGTGKSTLILQLIKQDIEAGRGVCVLDPHGDLIESVISLIPQSRIQDVLIIDPADSEFPVSFNILEAHSDIEKEILSSDLVGGFKRLSTSWGDQMNSVLANAILAFIESNRGGTLIDLRRFLIEKEFRNDFLKTVPDPSIQYYWLKEYPLLKSNSIGSILTRLDTFLRPKVIRNMVAQKKGINFEHLINTNKIILVKLSQGLIGVENSYLLGTFVVSKIHQAIMARQAMEKQARNPFFLYIDEFQNFITPSMGAILSGARKYHLGLVLAHQDLAQLIKNDSELASSVLANAGTRICFRLSDTDAKRLAEGFSHFESADLQNLGVGEAIARIGKPDNDFNLTTEPFTGNFENDKFQLVVEASRKQYATTRVEVEAILIKSYDGITTATPDAKRPIPQPIVEIRKDDVEKPKFEIIENEEAKDAIVKRKEISRHRFLQTSIKRLAEQRGYKALIEEELADQSGRVDVHVEGNGIIVACEVSVTTSHEWELHNIEKCIRAGYNFVFECVNAKSNIESMAQLVKSKLDAKHLNRVIIGDIESFGSFLDTLTQIPTDQPEVKTTKGYRVKIEYDTTTQDDIQRKKESITKIVMDSLQKIKK